MYIFLALIIGAVWVYGLTTNQFWAHHNEIFVISIVALINKQLKPDPDRRRQSAPSRRSLAAPQARITPNSPAPAPARAPSAQMARGGGIHGMTPAVAVPEEDFNQLTQALSMFGVPPDQIEAAIAQRRATAFPTAPAPTMAPTHSLFATTSPTTAAPSLFAAASVAAQTQARAGEILAGQRERLAALIPPSQTYSTLATINAERRERQYHPTSTFVQVQAALSRSSIELMNQSSRMRNLIKRALARESSLSHAESTPHRAPEIRTRPGVPRYVPPPTILHRPIRYVR